MITLKDLLNELEKKNVAEQFSYGDICGLEELEHILENHKRTIVDMETGAEIFDLLDTAFKLNYLVYIGEKEKGLCALNYDKIHNSYLNILQVIFKMLDLYWLE